MTSQDIGAQLAEWFRNRNPTKEIDWSANYHKTGLLDSFGIIELIAFAEDRFGIRFLDEDFKNPDFRTIAGLAAIIHQRMPLQQAAG